MLFQKQIRTLYSVLLMSNRKHMLLIDNQDSEKTYCKANLLENVTFPKNQGDNFHSKHGKCFRTIDAGNVREYS